MNEQRPVRRPRRAVDPVEQTQRYIRRIGIGLLLGSMVVDILWQQQQKLKMRRAALLYRLRRQVDPPGPVVASLAVSLLESTKHVGE